MDFRSMKRRELQVLCKKNRIPANLSNLEMASKLTELFQEKEKPSTCGWMKGQDDNKSGTESNVVLHREAKKVRFSPEHELIEFTRSREKKRRSKRISTLGCNSLPIVHVDKAGWKNRKVDCPVRVTQSREKLTVNGVLNGMKRGRNRVNNNHDRDNEVVDSVGVERIPGEILDDHRRVTRSRGKKLVESLVREKRRGEDNGIAVGKRKSLRNRGVVDEGKLDRDSGVMVKNNDKRREQILDGPSGVTSSRGKKVVKSLVREKTRDEDNGIAVGTRRSLRYRGVVDEGKLDRDSGVILKNNEKRLEQILEAKVTAKENMVVACQNLSRRSKRKSKIVDDSEAFKHDIGKHGNGSSMSLRNTMKSLAGKVLEVEVESAGVKVAVHGKIEADCQVDEPMKMELRRSSRRKLDILLHDESGKHNFTVVNDDYSLKTSVLHSETNGVSENDKKVIQPAMVRTRSKHTTLGQETVYIKGKLDSDAVEHNAERQQLIEPAGKEKLKRSRGNPFKNKSLEVINELGEDVVIQQKNQGRKRTRGHISGECFKNPDNDTIPLTRSKMETRGNEKTVSAGVVDKFADQIMLSNSLKEPNLLEDSSSKGLLENGESLCGKAQLSIPDAADGSNNTNAKNLTCNKRLASIRKHHRKDKETSASVGAVMKSIDISETIYRAEDLASEISDLQTDSSQSEIGISASKLMDAEAFPLLLRVAEHEIVEKIMSDDNSKHVVQVFGQSETFSNDIIAGSQKVLEASNIPGNLTLETGFSADGLVLADLEVTEAKADDKVQSNSPVLDHNQMKDMSAEENLETFEPINETHLLTGCHVEGMNHMEASNNADMGQKMGEAGVFEPCGEELINFTDSRSALEMKEPSSGNLRNSHESNHMAEGANVLVTNDTHSESDEAGESRNIKDLKLISDDNMEFGVSIPFDGGRSARTNWQDSEMCDAEYFIKDSDKDEKFHDPPVDVPANMLANSIGNERGRSLEVCQVGEGYETNVHNHAHSELAETKEGRCLNDHVRVTDEYDRLSVSAQFDGQRGACILPQDCVSCSDECSIKEPGRKGTFHDSEDAASTAMPAKHKDCKFTTGCSSLLDVNGSRSETSPKSEGSDTTIFAKGQIIEKEAGVSNTMEEKGANRSGNEITGITGDQKSLVDQINSGDCKIFNQAFESSKKTKYNPEPLKSPLAKPIATPNTGKCQKALSSISETAGHTMSIFKTGRKAEVSNQPVDENANGADCNNEKVDFADAQTLDVPMSMGGPTKRLSFGDKSEWKFQDIGEIENLCPSLIAHELSNLDEFTYKESHHSQQEIDVNNLFGSPVDRVTPSGPKEASTHGTDIANMTMSLTKSTTYKGLGNFNEMKQAMEEASQWDDYIPTDKSSTWPTTSKEEYDTGCYIGKEGYQLQFLFATPIKFVAPCKVDETSAYKKNTERADLSFVECFGTTKENKVTQTKSDEKVEVFGNELENYLGLGNLMLPNGKDVAPCKVDETSAYKKNTERADLSFVECFGTTKENKVTQTKSDEKVEVFGNELENYLGLGNLMLANGKDIRNPEINDVNDVGAANTCSYAVISKIKYDGNGKPWTENADENMRESNSLTKENVVDIENKEVNEDVGCQVAKTYSSTILSEAKYDGNEEQRTENMSECIKESNSISEKNEDVRVEGVNEVEMENNFSSTVLSEAKLDCKEKHWIDNTSERTTNYNSVTEQVEEDIRNEEVIEIESFEVENIFASIVLSEAKHDAYEEQCTKNTGEHIKESNSVTKKHGEENIFSLGQSLLHEKATDYDSKSSEKNIIIPGMKSLCAGKGSAEMLLDFNLSENNSYWDTDVKYEGEITQSSGDVPGITDNDIKEGKFVEDSDCFINHHKDDWFSRETSVDTFEKNLNPEVANMGSFNGETDEVIHKGSPPCISLKASHENCKVIESKDLEMTSDNNELFGSRTDEEDDHLTFSTGFLDELHTQSEMTLSKSQFDGYTLDNDVLSTNDGIQKTCEERALHHHSVYNMVTTAERESTFWGDEPEMLQSLATHLFVEENECNNDIRTKMETSNFNMEGNQEVDGGGVPQQLFMSEFHLEEDLKSDIRTVSDSSAYECNSEKLEESHLDNTIKECLEPEYSVAVLDDSDLYEPQRGTDERVAYPDDNYDKPSIVAESKEPEEPMLFPEPDEGSAMNETLVEKKLIIKDDHCSAAKKNARTILIHGTPNKLFLTDDMKENAPNTKRSQIGDYTTVRPIKRRALQDVRWK